MSNDTPMKTVPDLIEAIQKLDHTTEEFSDLYRVVNEKFFTFSDPDQFQQAAKTLNMILQHGEEWMVQVMASIGQQLFECVEKDIKATHGCFDIGGKQFFFDLYQDRDALGAVHKMFKNVVLRDGGK